MEDYYTISLCIGEIRESDLPFILELINELELSHYEIIYNDYTYNVILLYKIYNNYDFTNYQIIFFYEEQNSFCDNFINKQVYYVSNSNELLDSLSFMTKCQQFLK